MVTEAQTSPRPETVPDAWTGGQYSMFRALFGLSLAGYFAFLLGLRAELFGTYIGGLSSPALQWLVDAFGPVAGGEFLYGLLIIAGVLQLMVAIGWQDRVAALLLTVFWVCLFGRDPLVSVIGQAVVVLLLLSHAAMPRAPYGSLEAYGRIDPRGGWHHDRRMWEIGWCALGVVYAVWGGFLLASLLVDLWDVGSAPTFTGWIVLASVLLFAPLVLFRRLRPWLWTLLLGGQLLRIALVGVEDAIPMIVLLHAFTFDPAWLAPRAGDGPSTVFYDGECGLCHRFVRMLLAEDSDGESFRFSPLKGTTFAVAVPEGPLGQLPDSVIVRSPGGDLLMHSDATLHCLQRLGGAWRLIAILVRLVPRPVRDGVYKGIAAIRKSLFKRPDNACPILPPDLQQRFLP